jgi:hypothetical protein
VGGTAAAIHAGHRVSVDADYVIKDMKPRFNDIFEKMKSVPGWKVNYSREPVIILGELDGIQVGFRNLIRNEPLELEQVDFEGGKIIVPTLDEMLRIKGHLVAKRNCFRDYIDFAALSSAMNPERIGEALMNLDKYYPQTGNLSALMTLQENLATFVPIDAEGIELSEYKKLEPYWQSRDTIEKACFHASIVITETLLKNKDKSYDSASLLLRQTDRWDELECFIAEMKKYMRKERET